MPTLGLTHDVDFVYDLMPGLISDFMSDLLFDLILDLIYDSMSDLSSDFIPVFIMRSLETSFWKCGGRTPNSSIYFHCGHKFTTSLYKNRLFHPKPHKNKIGCHIKGHTKQLVVCIVRTKGSEPSPEGLRSNARALATTSPSSPRDGSEALSSSTHNWSRR